MVAGRAFTSAENVAGGRPVIVVNETMARTFWPGEPALGHCVRVGFVDPPCAEVVGISANAAMRPTLQLSERDAPMMYFGLAKGIDDNVVLGRGRRSQVVEDLRAITSTTLGPPCELSVVVKVRLQASRISKGVMRPALSGRLISAGA
jgi:hypothetical protein